MTKASFLDSLDRAIFMQAVAMLVVGVILIAFAASTTRLARDENTNRLRDSVAVREVAGND